MATQTVTVLFTDLVGSTALSSRLAPDDAEAVRVTHFGLLRGAIAAAGGTEVKNLGDGLMVAFTSLSRALACAVAMQQAIERHNQRGGEALSVRIGISTGEATEEDGDYFGDPVVEAARLCAAADGGQILATELVRLVAGRHATQEFAPVGDLDLKGLPDPVPAVEVVWEPTAATGASGEQVPLPVRLVGASSESLFAFFGRTAELGRLTDARKASAAERVLRVSLVSGEPGIGKTTLVAQAARAAHADGTIVLYGGCEEGLTVPYQPWVGALTHLVDHADEAMLRAFVDAHGPALERLVPALGRRLSLPVLPPGSDADADRYLVLDGVARLLATASSDAPIVVVLDDLHWVDAASVQLLRHLVTSPVPMAVHVVGTYRESDLSRTHPLVGALAELRREPSVERLELTGLDDVDVVDLLGAAAGHEVADDGVALAHALRRETGGNPFFLVEVIRHLAETGAFTQDDDGRWVVAGGADDLGLPSSVREVVAHRVARLGPDSEKALSLAAVVGRDFDLDLLAGLLDQDEDDLLDLLDGAIAAGLVTEPEHQFGRYRFVHALIQHTLYQELSAARRQRSHQRIAEALEARAGARGAELPVTELAHHWLAATRPSDTAKALHYAAEAGDAALAAFAPQDAIDWYRQALDLLDRQGDGDDHTRCTLLVGLGTAQCRAAQSEFRDTLREAGRIARRLGDRDLLVAAARSRDPGIEMMGEVDPDRLALVEAALEAVGPSDSADRAHLLAGLAEEMDPRDRTRTAVAFDAVDLAHRVGDEREFLAILLLASNPMTTPDSLDRRRDEATQAIEVAERLGDSASLSGVLALRMMVAGEAGDLAEFDLRLAQVASIVERYGSPVVRYQHLMFRSWRHLVAGHLDAAVVDADAALDLGTRLGMGHAASTYGSHLLQQALQKGRLDELVELIEQTVTDVPTIPAWRAALMSIYNELGRYDEATALFDLGFAAAFDDVPFDLTWLPTMGNYAETAADTGRVDAAPLLYDRLLPYVDRMLFAASLDWGLVSRALGRLATLLGRYDDAEDLLGQAQSRHEAMGAPYWIARTRIDRAELALARRAPGDAEAADTLILDALTAADDYGYGGLVSRAERLTSS